MSHFRHDRPGTPAADWAARAEWADVPALDLAGIDRIVVVAAHPDDESLGAGGLVAAAHRAGLTVALVLLTAGERSHPRSPTTSAAALAGRRRAECDAAWVELGGDPGEVSFWDLPDGELARHELVPRLVATLGDARATLLVTPWRADGHLDHDALGAAGRVAAYRTGARHLAYPIWFWHRADPASAPWGRLVRMALGDHDRAAKARAIGAHATQVGPLSAAAGDETLLGPDLLAHFAGDHETYVEEPPADDALDALHTEHADPWGTETRWYEQRKRDLLLAMLPRRRYARGLDVGCSTGTMSAALADRCDTLVAVDRSPTAVLAARERLGAAVDVRRLDVPAEWPDGGFDLIVVSESGYFLSPAGLDRLIERMSGSLRVGGSLVLAHWRHPVVGWPLDGPRVHERAAAAAGLPPVAARYVDRDVQIALHTTAPPDPAG